eukprot:GEZU01024390.1.p1 GENE.GEZU01024390.1~~GEZU01024390.1.p1  ORF type:complete len:408 (-),score=110.38 GEZU01024390.1:70-1293(-)
MQSTEQFASKSALIGVPTGILLGVFLEKSNVYKQRRAKEQMDLKDSTLLKTYLASAATGILSFTALRTMPNFNASVFAPKPTHLTGDIIGGVMMGVGTTIARTVPGSILVQLGACYPNSLFTGLGGLMGAFAFEYLEPSIQENLLGPSSGVLTLPGILNVPYWMVSIPLAAAMYGAAYLMSAAGKRDEKAVRVDTATGSGPRGAEAHVHVKMDTDVLREKQWSPMVSGIGLGLLQVPVFYLMNQNLNEFTSPYLNAASRTYSVVRNPSNPQESAIRDVVRAKSSLQLMIDLGIVAGSRISAQYSGNFQENFKEDMDTYKDVPGNFTKKGLAALGGFMMVFGSLLGDQWTGGNDMSGLAQLSGNLSLTSHSLSLHYFVVVVVVFNEDDGWFEDPPRALVCLSLLMRFG